MLLDTDSIRLRRPRSTWPSNFYKLLAFNCNFLFYIALLQFFKTGNLAVVAYLYLLGPHSSTILLSFSTHCFGKELYSGTQLWKFSLNTSHVRLFRSGILTHCPAMDSVLSSVSTRAGNYLSSCSLSGTLSSGNKKFLTFIS